MPTKEIPLSEWVTYFDQFSRQHEGWRATVEVLGSEIGAETEAREKPLMGITADLKDQERAISIILGSKGSEHLTHTVFNPKSVRIKQSEMGADEALAIESNEGTTTILTFRSPMRTEMLDEMP